MAESVREKSRGLKFAEEQLLRHGWEHGKDGDRWYFYLFNHRHFSGCVLVSYLV